MSLSPRIAALVWLPALVGAGAFCLWSTAIRIDRVNYVSDLVPTGTVVDPASPTGYADGLRQLIIPDNNNASSQWIVQTQQMLARHEWRVHHVAYDNAPVGREVFTASPYRWWLGAVAWMDHLVFSQPLGIAVERAALVADPALQLLFLIGTAAFVARRFGGAAAALVSLAIVALYPFGGSFLPGEPDGAGLALCCAVWSVLLLLGGIHEAAVVNGAALEEPAGSVVRTRRWFLAAGVAGGIGLWIHSIGEAPVLAGIVLGGLLAALAARRAAAAGGGPPEVPLPWRHWALAGAGTSLAAYLIEYAPAHLASWRLEVVHPVYGLTWLAAAEWMTWVGTIVRRRGWPGIRRMLLILVPLALTVAGYALLARLQGNRGLLVSDVAAMRLTALPGSPIAPSLWAWVRQDGFGLPWVATGLPVLAAIAAAVWMLVRAATPAPGRTGVAVALGPVLTVIILAFLRLRWWNSVDAMVLPLLVATVPALATTLARRVGRWVAVGASLAALAPGIWVLGAGARADEGRSVSEGDVVQLIERDLAQWLASVSGGTGAVVLAPPGMTTMLYFNGGLAGLGTLDRDNPAGVLAAIRLAGASSPDEAQALARGRDLKYIVMPSWDNALDQYAHLGSNQYQHTLMALLHRWLPPRWLEPVPYHLPTIAGFEGQSVAIFKVVDVQDNATALSHLAEYFVEMGDIPKAIGVAYTLQHSFPADLGAAVARALVARASDDPDAFAAAMDDVQNLVNRGDDRTLPWDRRVSLAIALAEGKRFDLARHQVQQCLATADETRVRSLTTQSLYRLQVLGRVFGLPVRDTRIQKLMRRLLPAELRDKV